jgi:hypothetical protein
VGVKTAVDEFGDFRGCCDDWRSTPHPEAWLPMEWPVSDQEPPKHWLGPVAADLSLREAVRLAKHRWIIERDYEELDQEVGIGHPLRLSLVGDYRVVIRMTRTCRSPMMTPSP